VARHIPTSGRKPLRDVVGDVQRNFHGLGSSMRMVGGG
jgi:hypothetical protein